MGSLPRRHRRVGTGDRRHPRCGERLRRPLRPRERPSKRGRLAAGRLGRALQPGVHRVRPHRIRAPRQLRRPPLDVPPRHDAARRGLPRRRRGDRGPGGRRACGLPRPDRDRQRRPHPPLRRSRNPRRRHTALAGTRGHRGGRGGSDARPLPRWTGGFRAGASHARCGQRLRAARRRDQRGRVQRRRHGLGRDREPGVHAARHLGLDPARQRSDRSRRGHQPGGGRHGRGPGRPVRVRRWHPLLLRSRRRRYRHDPLGLGHHRRGVLVDRSRSGRLRALRRRRR
ncbi:hypothetical protein SRABI128_04480 [Microbacterium sp. Bi128]|nr:hypothetical protein SRABI128_04480 [Microbacterium sp. Bi128]